MTVLLTFLAVGVCAADLDIAGAKGRYDRQRTIADGARARYSAKAQILEGAQSRQSAAESAEAQAIQTRDQAEQRLHDLDHDLADFGNQINGLENDLLQTNQWISNLDAQFEQKGRERDRLQREGDQLDRQIQNVSQKISDLENQPHPGDWICNYVDKGWEEHGGGHPVRAGNRNAAENQSKAACDAVHGTCVFSGCRQDDPPELENLRQRLARLQQDRADNQRYMNDMMNQLYAVQNELARANAQLQTGQQNVQNARSRLAQAQHDRDYQVRVVADANDLVRRARSVTDSARQEVALARPPYVTAKSEYEYEDGLAQNLFAYYQQVVNNYNAALNDVYVRADSAASLDGGREASDRAPGPGGVDGEKVGRVDGVAKAKKDANARDLAKGYANGRSVGASDAALAASYKDGTSAGQLSARQKAHLESYPKGYNEALRGHLSAPLALAATVDITDQISSDPGGNGQFLKLSELKVGQGMAPSVLTPKEPPFGVPSTGSPSVAVPSLLKAYYSPPCTGLVLTEFEPLCRSRYDNAYSNQFASQYRSLYTSEYRKAFDVSAASSYQATLGATDVAAYAQGRASGAKDQGLLDGFANAEPIFHQEEVGFGKVALKDELTKGALLVVRAARLEETSGDGLYTPGEAVKVTLVIDNYGGQSTALGKIRARIAGASGLGTFALTVRDLPALAAATSTTLTGIVSAPIATEAPGDKIQLDVALEADSGAGFKELAKVRADTETGFPLELTAITLAKDPKVNEKVEAKFKFKNRTSADIKGVKTELSSSPAFVSFTKNKVDLPDIATGAEVEVPVEIAAGPWVGDDTYVRFLSQLTFADGRAMKQALRKFVNVTRSVSLLLNDGNGQPVPSSTVRVKAGSSFAIQVQMKFKAKSALPGPFVLRAGKISNPLITFGNGSTTSVNYGSLSPSSNPGKVRMVYNVPASLKGKAGEYVMVEANDGSTTQHALMVYLDIY